MIYICKEVLCKLQHKEQLLKNTNASEKKIHE